VKYSREMCVPNGALSMICEPACQSYLVGLNLRFYLSDMIVEPCGAQCPVSVSIVSIIVARHAFQNALHAFRRDFGEERLDKSLMDQVGEIYKNISIDSVTLERKLSLALPAIVSTC